MAEYTGDVLILMWPAEKTSQPTDSALLSVYKLNMCGSAIAQLGYAGWCDMRTGPAGTELTEPEAVWAEEGARPSPLTSAPAFPESQAAVREIP